MINGETKNNSSVKNYIYSTLIVIVLGAAGFWVYQSYNLTSTDGPVSLGIAKNFNLKAGLDLITGKKVEEEKKEEPIDLSIFDDQKFKRMQSSAVKLKNFRLGKQNPFDKASSGETVKNPKEKVDGKSFLDIKEEDFFSL